MSDARIQLSNGTLFDLLEPDPDLIDIEVIAHALSFLCRFTGHGTQFYSVAQHCVVVSRLVPAEDALAGLLHDGAEAFVGDVSTPLKRLLPDYRVIEDAIDAAIMIRFGIVYNGPQVKHADKVAMATERRDLGINGNDEFWAEFWPLPDPAPWVIHPLDPEAARVAFLARFAEIVLHPGQGQAPGVAQPAQFGAMGVPIGQPDVNRFEDNEDVSRRLSEAETEEDDGRKWMVVG